MNSLALSLLGLAPLPGAPVKTVSSLPPVRHELYGMNIMVGTREQRAALHEKRLAAIEEYVRENGPIKTGALSEAFGIIREAMTKDLKHLEKAGRVRMAAGMKPTHWEA